MGSAIKEPPISTPRASRCDIPGANNRRILRTSCYTLSSFYFLNSQYFRSWQFFFNMERFKGRQCHKCFYLFWNKTNLLFTVLYVALQKRLNMFNGHFFSCAIKIAAYSRGAYHSSYAQWQRRLCCNCKTNPSFLLSLQGKMTFSVLISGR